MSELASIYYGSKYSDTNLCDASTQFYKLQDEIPDLTSYKTSTNL